MKIDSSSLKKLNLYGKIFKVLWYLGIIAGILIIVLAVLYQTGLMRENFGLKLEYMGIGIEVDSQYFDNNIFLVLQFSLLILWALFMYILYQIKYIINNTIKQGTPFIEENINVLRYIARSFFVATGLIIMLEVVMGIFFNASNIFAEVNKLKGIELTQSISLPEWPIIIGVLIMILAEIFKHGHQLQQDSESIV